MSGPPGEFLYFLQFLLRNDMGSGPSGQPKERVWYVDAAIELCAGAGAIAFLFGGSCAFSVPGMCVTIVGFAALAIFLALTVFLIYLALTSKRR
jgi:hypothetical protein